MKYYGENNCELCFPLWIAAKYFLFKHSSIMQKALSCVVGKLELRSIRSAFLNSEPTLSANV